MARDKVRHIKRWGITAGLLIAGTVPAAAFARPIFPPGWQVNANRLDCTYRLTDFAASVSFVGQLVAPANQLDHHPDVAIAYNRVSLSLTTHDAKGLTDLDWKLAAKIDEIAGHQKPPLRCLDDDQSSNPST